MEDRVSDPQTFVDRLVFSLFDAQKLKNSKDAVSLLENCFAVLLEASLYSRNLWRYFHATGYCSRVLTCLLLEDSRQDVRQAAADRLKGICSALPT